MNPLENLLGAGQVGGTLILSPLLRSWYNRWGATAEEIRQPLPGDELAPVSQLGYTRALTIRAPAERVWPWLAQIGQGRGGLYSYSPDMAWIWRMTEPIGFVMERKMLLGIRQRAEKIIGETK